MLTSAVEWIQWVDVRLSQVFISLLSNVWTIATTKQNVLIYFCCYLIFCNISTIPKIIFLFYNINNFSKTSLIELLRILIIFIKLEKIWLQRRRKGGVYIIFFTKNMKVINECRPFGKPKTHAFGLVLW